MSFLYIYIYTEKTCERHTCGRQETHDSYLQSWAKQGLKPLNEWTSRTAGWRTPWPFKSGVV